MAGIEFQRLWSKRAVSHCVPVCGTTYQPACGIPGLTWHLWQGATGRWISNCASGTNTQYFNCVPVVVSQAFLACATHDSYQANWCLRFWSKRAVFGWHSSPRPSGPCMLFEHLVVSITNCDNYQVSECGVCGVDSPHLNDNHLWPSHAVCLQHKRQWRNLGLSVYVRHSTWNPGHFSFTIIQQAKLWGSLPEIGFHWYHVFNFLAFQPTDSGEPCQYFTAAYMSELIKLAYSKAVIAEFGIVRDNSKLRCYCIAILMHAIITA